MFVIHKYVSHVNKNVNNIINMIVLINVVNSYLTLTVNNYYNNNIMNYKMNSMNYKYNMKIKTLSLNYYNIKLMN